MNKELVFQALDHIPDKETWVDEKGEIHIDLFLAHFHLWGADDRLHLTDVIRSIADYDNPRYYPIRDSFLPTDWAYYWSEALGYLWRAWEKQLPKGDSRPLNSEISLSRDEVVELIQRVKDELSGEI